MDARFVWWIEVDQIESGVAPSEISESLLHIQFDDIDVRFRTVHAATRKIGFYDTDAMRTPINERHGSRPAAQCFKPDVSRPRAKIQKIRVNDAVAQNAKHGLLHAVRCWAHRVRLDRNQAFAFEPSGDDSHQDFRPVSIT